jgi:hypothetical protein
MRVGSVVGVMLDEVDVTLEETVQATADSSPPELRFDRRPDRRGDVASIFAPKPNAGSHDAGLRLCSA